MVQKEIMYTPIEMASMYRQAKDKDDTIKVLMLGNCMSEAEVVEILRRQGIDHKPQPRKPGPKPGTKTGPRAKKPKPAAEEPAAPIPLPEPESVTDEKIIAVIKGMQARKTELEQELAVINTRLNLIRMTFCEEEPNE